jgi:hypothetical protein
MSFLYGWGPCYIACLDLTRRFFSTCFRMRLVRQSSLLYQWMILWDTLASKEVLDVIN